MNQIQNITFEELTNVMKIGLIDSKHFQEQSPEEQYYYCHSKCLYKITGVINGFDEDQKGFWLRQKMNDTKYIPIMVKLVHINQDLKVGDQVTVTIKIISSTTNHHYKAELMKINNRHESQVI